MNTHRTDTNGLCRVVGNYGGDYYQPWQIDDAPKSSWYCAGGYANENLSIHND